MSVVRVIPSDDVDKFNSAMEEQGMDKIAKIYSIRCRSKRLLTVFAQSEWFMPDEYKNMNVIEHLVKLTNTPQEYKRVDEELEEFKKRNMLDLLKYMISFQIYARKQNCMGCRQRISV